MKLKFSQDGLEGLLMGVFATLLTGGMYCHIRANEPWWAFATFLLIILTVIAGSTILKEDKSNQLREQLADYAHDAWLRWMAYLFSKCYQGDRGQMTIPIDSVKRWQRQLTTEYKDLPNGEQASARREANKILNIINKHPKKGS